MGLTMSEKRALTDQVVRRYRRAGKKEKGVILGEFVQTTGYRRKYAIHLLELMGSSPNKRYISMTSSRPDRVVPVAVKLMP